MSEPSELQRLTLAGIAHRCTRETELFLKRSGHDPRYCFELFRRAIAERDSRAWEFIYTVYRPLVAKWVRRHAAYSSTGEEVQYFVNRAFEKMWTALPPSRFGQFPNLKSLLRYLQMCVHSVILDDVRAAGPPVAETPLEHLAASHAGSAPTVEQQALSRVHGEELWREIIARLNDEKERRVVYCSFVLALKPRQICAQFPEAFPDVNGVYRIKENVLARLRRDDELRRLLG